MHVKHGVEFRDLQKVPNFLGEMEKLQLSSAGLDRGIGVYQLSDAGTVDVIYVGEIDQNFCAIVIKQLANGLSKQRTSVTQDDASAQVDYGDVPRIPISSVKRHGVPLKRFSAGPYHRLNCRTGHFHGRC